MSNVKDLVLGRVYFLYYRDGELWYEAGRHLDGETFQFPVPISETGNATFLANDMGILYMRYIKKHMAQLDKDGSLA